MAEGESVVAGVLFEERGEVGVGCGWWSVEGEEACGECGEGAEDEKDYGDALAGAGERVGDGEGFGFGGFVVEPGGDEEDERGEGRGGRSTPGGWREEKKRSGMAAQRPRRRRVLSVAGESADGDAGAEGFAPGEWRGL